MEQILTVSVQTQESSTVSYRVSSQPPLVTWSCVSRDARVRQFAALTLSSTEHSVREFTFNELGGNEDDKEKGVLVVVIRTMPVFPTSSKRTRSQLTLPEFNFTQLGRSPLKDARTAHRNTHHVTPPIAQQVDVLDADPKSAVADVSSISSREHGKRASSPLKEAQPAKRRRQDGSDSENQSATPSPMTTVTSLPEISEPTPVPPFNFSNVSSSPSKHNTSLQPNSIPLPKDIPDTVVDHDQVSHKIPVSHTQDNSQCVPLVTVVSTLQQSDSVMGDTTDVFLSPNKWHHQPRTVGSSSCTSGSTSSSDDPVIMSPKEKAISGSADSPSTVPFIDFNRIPPSPSKLRERLNIVSISSSDSTSCPSDHGDVRMVDPIPVPAVPSSSSSSPPPPPPPPLPLPPTPPLSGMPSSPSLGTRAVASMLSHKAVPYTPTSPLTPLPLTPHSPGPNHSSQPQTPSPIPPSSQERNLNLITVDDDPTPRPIQRVKSIPVPVPPRSQSKCNTVSASPSRIPSPEVALASRPVTPSKSVTEARSRPVTPSASTSTSTSTSMSRLPRPSVAPGTRPSSRALKPEEPAESANKPKEKKPRSKAKTKVVVPLGGRMTRSAALRQQEIKRKEEIRASSSSESFVCFPASLRWSGQRISNLTCHGCLDQSRNLFRLRAALLRALL